MQKLMRETADFLLKMADDIDGWAEQSRSGGWSTHQVTANREAAAKLRERAALMYRAANKSDDRVGAVACEQCGGSGIAA